MRIFCIKSCKIRLQTPVLLLPPTNIAWSVPVSGVENTAVPKGQILCFCFFRAFAPIFHFKLCNFCWWERTNIFCPRAQGTLATPL